MKPQYENLVMSSFVLWLDHLLLKSGEAFTNVSSSFYKVQDIYNGIYTYAAPFKSLVSDFSIPNATIITGVYLNGNFITTGVSGLTGINYQQGQLYFNAPLPSNTSLTGSYAINEFNIALTDRTDEDILFKTKYFHKNYVSQPQSGLSPEAATYPIIYIKNDGGRNDPFAFGGTDITKNFIKMIILADSDFALSAVKSIIKDRVRTYIPLIQASEMPFNFLGGYSNENYNYDMLTSGRFQMSNSLCLEEITVMTPGSEIFNAIKTENPGIFVAIAELDVYGYRNPRGC